MNEQHFQINMQSRERHQYYKPGTKMALIITDYSIMKISYYDNSSNN